MSDKDLDPCVICKRETAETIGTTSDSVHQVCPRCHEFILTGTASSIATRLDNNEITKLSGWIYDQNKAGLTPTINSDALKTIISRRIPSVKERADRLLIEGAGDEQSLNGTFNIEEPRFLAATYSQDKNDVSQLSRILSDSGYLEHQTMGGSVSISPYGYMYLDEITRIISDSSQAFIAMWFDPSMDNVYSNGFQQAILDSGYDPIRIDQKEHINKIDDEIIASIQNSKFVVADFTKHRGGVYFEAGYAFGLGLPVFWICRKDNMDELHFDIRQYNCIDWETPVELRKRLINRIKAVVGIGPKSNAP